jgi:uncharacterized MAPEG superfamily protein
MTTELYWLTLTLVLTGLLWVPYILQLIVQQGMLTALWDPTGAHPHEADWALRAKSAHTNAIENIAVFAPLVMLVEMQGMNGGITETAAAVFFFVRLAHYFIFMAALPVIRTVAFMIGFGCQMVMAGRLLGMV